MSIFGKKWDGEHSGAGRGTSRHGIGDVIRLLRTLPVDQHPELVVQVIRSTLESLEVVHVSDLIQDAVKQEQKLNERIATLRAQMQELSKQIDTHREEVTRLEADLSETTVAKERLVFAEQAAAAGSQPVSSPRASGPLPPPQMPPPKSAAPASLEPTPHNARG
jgi:TolA-binding protein